MDAWVEIDDMLTSAFGIVALSRVQDTPALVDRVTMEVAQPKPPRPRGLFQRKEEPVV